MRIFVGIKISKEFQERIVAWQKSFLKLPVRWIAPEDLHITLIPPWSEKNIEGVKNTLEAASAEIRSFEIDFEKIIYGPHPKKPRLIWAEAPVNKEFVDLTESFESVFEEHKSKFPPRPHVTIARFRHWQFKEFSIQTLDEAFVLKEHVVSVVLFESLRIPKNNIKYKVLYEARFEQ